MFVTYRNKSLEHWRRRTHACLEGLKPNRIKDPRHESEEKEEEKAKKRATEAAKQAAIEAKLKAERAAKKAATARPIWRIGWS